MYDFEAASQLVPFRITVVDAQGQTHKYEDLYLTSMDASIDAQQRYPGAKRVEVEPA